MLLDNHEKCKYGFQSAVILYFTVPFIAKELTSKATINDPVQRLVTTNQTR